MVKVFQNQPVRTLAEELSASHILKRSTRMRAPRVARTPAKARALIVRTQAPFHFVVHKHPRRSATD